jgi:tetratricopeptide (TPR) repeat protein
METNSMCQEPPARSQPLPEIDVTQLEPMARAQEAAGNLQAAAATWQRLIELWPQDDRVIAEFGSFHLRRGNFTEALAWYTQALALSDSNRGAHFGVSIALRAVGKLDDAILSVRRAIALNPGIGEYNSNLGHMLVSAGRSLEAIAAFEQAIALEPQNAGIHQALAALRLLDGDLETTIEQARAALSPDVASTHLRLGQLLIRGNRYVEAASALEEAVLIEPANVALRLTLADVYNELGRFESAVFELRQALRTARDRADIRLALSRTRERMGEVAAAVVVAADGPANDVLHPQRRRLQDIEAGHRHAVVPLRYFDATFEVLLGGEAITTTSPLVHTNLGDFDADFARHHAEVLYV